MKHLRPLFLLLLIMCLTAAPALSETAAYEYEEVLETVTLDDDLLPDADEALQGYIDTLLGVHPEALFVPRNLGAELTGGNKALYDALSSLIEQVAAGEQASTAFSVSRDELGLEAKLFTAEELGVEALFDSNGSTTDEAKAALKEQMTFDLTTVNRTLLVDHPYEFYWFNKTKGVNISYGIRRTSTAIGFGSTFTFYYTVSNDYATGTYVVDTARTQAVQTAIANAQAVVDQYADVSDYNKLYGYRQYICDHVSYDKVSQNALKAGEDVYGDPWQLISVFDDDTSTNVVCEGYSKAFQYLCDMTTFSDNDNTTCYVVTGNLNAENNGHMWNIVRMPNGKNYLVDVTNCDTGTAGYPDKLFMAGTATGSVDEGYTFAGAYGTKYMYKEDTLNLFSTSELTLSEYFYLEESYQVMTLPSSLTSIGDEAFAGIATEKVVIPEGCTEIGARAFADCVNLSEVVIPATVQTIADDAFEGCPSVFILSASEAIRAWAAEHGISAYEP